ERPLSYRQGGEPPRLVRAGEGELLATALREAAERDGLLAVIAPRSLASTPPHGETFDETSIPVLTPREAKGLEFDHVVLVDAADEDAHRRACATTPAAAGVASVSCECDRSATAGRKCRSWASARTTSGCGSSTTARWR